MPGMVVCAQSGSALPKKIMVEHIQKKQRLLLLMKLLTRAVAAANKEKASLLHVTYEVWEFLSDGVGLDPKNRKMYERRRQMRWRLCDETADAEMEALQVSNCC